MNMNSILTGEQTVEDEPPTNIEKLEEVVAEIAAKEEDEPKS